MNDSFTTLGVAADIAQKLTELSFTVPTPIQAQAIPLVLQERDVIGIAQTGTGKTLAFGVPMIQRISDLKGRGKGLIILPTRELAEQVETTLLTIGRSFGLRTALLIGGAAMGKQVLALRRKPHIIIGTPGRIVDHLEQGTLQLDQVAMLVLDEADRMLDMGFAPQVNAILERVPRQRQTLLFSATMPREIEQMVATQLTNPARVQIAASGTTAAMVEQGLYLVDRQQKAPLLAQLLKETPGPVIVFSRTKHGARKLRDTVERFGETAAEIHGNRSLPQRREALAGFKSHRYHVLVATDVAARGIDVSQVALVINYDLPDQAEDYIHRIGRTGRAGNAGRAVSFATRDQGQLVRAIERLIRTQIPRLPLPTTLPSVASVSTEPMRRDQSFHRQNRHRLPDRERVIQQPVRASEFNEARDYYQPFVAERTAHNEQWGGPRQSYRNGRPRNRYHRQPGR